jgi:hypothetical protein
MTVYYANTQPNFKTARFKQPAGSEIEERRPDQDGHAPDRVAVLPPVYH